MRLEVKEKRTPLSLSAAPILPVATGLLALIIFVVDTITNLEIAVAVFYVAVVLLSVSFCRRYGVVLISAGCMALTVISSLLTAHGSLEAGIINLDLSSAIAVTTYLALRIEAAQAAIHEARAQLAHIARVTTLGELTTSIAHEVNQPLAALVTNANACSRWLAVQPPNLKEATEAIEEIVEDANRAAEIVNRIRRLAKRHPPERERLDINEIIRETIRLTDNELRRNQIMVRTQFSDELPGIRGDRILLQQVVLNLILNAVEAIDASSGGQREILINTSTPETGGVQVDVVDSGVGIDATKVGQLFEAFYTTKSDGLGMGLTLSRSVIETHAGRMWATRNEPRGACLHFTIPEPSGTRR